jgi:hypothetical protein
VAEPESFAESDASWLFFLMEKIIVKAESHEVAAKMFQEHPHFTIFPGDGVEIMECMPIPGM